MMTKLVFKQRIAPISYVWGFVMLGCVALWSSDGLKEGRYFAFTLFTLILVLVWYFIFVYSKYWIEENLLIVRTFGKTTKIDIKKIRKVETNQLKLYRFSFFNPPVKGTIIHFNHFDEVFVNPDDLRGFIAELQAINPEIECVD